MEYISIKKYSYSKKIENSSSLEMLISIFNNLIDKIKEYVFNLRDSNYGSTLNKAIDYLNKYYMNDISLSSVSNCSHLNKSYLSQLFKQKTGKNFNHYLTKIRIDKAKILLRNTENSINLVCEKVGFTNQSYFGKMFKQVVGMNTSEYSKIYKSSKNNTSYQPDSGEDIYNMPYEDEYSQLTPYED